MACLVGTATRDRLTHGVAQKLFLVTLSSAAVTAGVIALGGRPCWAETADHRFTINVGVTTVTEGLWALQRSTGAKLVFSPEQLDMLRTNGVTGEFTIDEALKRLLDGSGFKAQSTGGDTDLIVDAGSAH